MSSSQRLDRDRIEHLVSESVAGNEEAFAELTRGLSSVLWSVVRSFRLGEGDAQDVVQGVWLQLAQHLSRLREPGRLPGWLATTTRNECLLVVRRNGRFAVSELTPEIEDRGDPTDAGILRNERIRAVRSALNAMDERCRQLLSLVANVPPLTYGDISEMLAMPVSAIGPTRGRCLEKLRKHRSVRQLLENED